MGRAQAQQTPEKLVLAAGQEGGIYLKLGRAIADAAKENSLNIEVLPSSGSQENIQSLVEGRVQLAFVQSDVAHRAWARHEPFVSLSTEESARLRLVVPLYTEVVQVVVRPHLYVFNTAGLSGKRVSVGREGSGTHLTALAVLEASGLSENQLFALHLPLDEAAVQVKAGTIDAMFRTSAVPTPSIAHIMGESEVRLIRLDREIIDRLVEGEAYIETAVPLGTYPNQAKLVPTIAVQALLLTRDDTPSAVVSRVIGIVKERKSLIEKKGGVSLDRLGRSVAPNLRRRAHSGALVFLPPAKELGRVATSILFLAILTASFVFLYHSRIWRVLTKRTLDGRPLRPRDKLLAVFAVVMLIWLFGSLGLYLSEGNVNEHFDSIPKSAWSMLVYVAGGFQARVPMTRGGEIVAVLATAFGVAAVAWVASEFATHLVRNELDRLIKILKGEKPMPDLKGHIVIVNWDERVKDMILELHGRTFREKVPIVIVSEAGVRLPEQKEFDEVAEVVGDPVSKRTLERAEVRQAHSITILSSWPSGDAADRRRRLDPEVADAKTITTILAVRQLPGGESVPITAEIRAKKNCESALNAGGGHEKHIEVICAEEFGTDIITQCAVTPGLATLYTRLLTFTPESNEIYKIKIPANLVGKTFGELLQEFAKRRKASKEAIIPLGISRGSKSYLNPRDDNQEVGILKAEDFLFVMSYTKPELA